MSRWRQLVAIGVMFGMLHLTLIDVARSAEPAALPNPTVVKQQVDQLGVGAKVKIRLANGKKLNGTIQSIEEGSFLVASKQSSPTPVAYEQVARLKLAKITYKSKATVDVEEARRVVVGLGVGRHIMVKTAAGKEYHGNILAIGAESFTILPDHHTAAVQVAYGEILQTGPNLSKGEKITLGVVVVAVAVVIGVLLWATQGG